MKQIAGACYCVCRLPLLGIRRKDKRSGGWSRRRSLLGELSGFWTGRFCSLLPLLYHWKQVANYRRRDSFRDADQKTEYLESYVWRSTGEDLVSME